MEERNGTLNYWEKKEHNKKQAEKIAQWAAANKAVEIKQLAEKTVLMPELKDIPDGEHSFDGTEWEVIQCSTVDAIRQECEKGNRVCVLNFASYKAPGGLFLDGSMAQEESLCHASLLYPVLSSERVKAMFYDQHQNKLNKALYHSDMLYTPDVPFWQSGKEFCASVITCAAPNKKAAQKYQAVPENVCSQVMKERIAAVLHTACVQEEEVLILGAFGCGIFGNDLNEVSEMFRDLLTGKFGGSFRRIIFAVLDTKSYETMRNILIQ